MAFDHNLLSSVDVVHSEWPVVLITNPKVCVSNCPDAMHPLLILCFNF